MTCANKRIEHNLERDCWLPINPLSPFSLCSRCDYERVEELLQKPESLEFWCLDRGFLSLLTKKRHQDSLLNALAKLCEQEYAFFPKVYEILASSSFEVALAHGIYTHKPSSRCKLYLYAFKQMKKNHQLVHTDLPWKCWPCLTKILRTKSIHAYRPFINGLIRNIAQEPQTVPEYIVDILVTLNLLGKDHAVRLVFDNYRRAVSNEDIAKNLLAEFLGKPCMIDKLFQNTCVDYIPFEWQSDTFMGFLRKKALSSVKAHNYVFKEDLMIKTWAPHRLFAWCLDLDDLNDFN